MKVIAFTGFKHVGKTFWGKNLSQKLQVPFYDLDQELEIFHKQSVSSIYKNIGKDSFHKLEYECLKKQDFSYERILSLGGATLLYKPSLELIQANAEIILLSDTKERIQHRIFSSAHRWSALEGYDCQNRFDYIYHERMQYYTSLNLLTFDLSYENQVLQLEDYVRQFFR